MARLYPKLNSGYFPIIVNPMIGTTPAELFTAIITLVIAFTFHEFAHAWTAVQFGDDTPLRFGRLTLNPLKHLDFMGSLMLVFTGFGWAKPVPVNHYKISQHSDYAVMLVAISGPLSNFILAAIAAVPLRFGLVDASASTIGFLPSFSGFLFYFLITNLGLMLFNLIPLPPLDGEEILTYLLPPDLERKYEEIRPYGPYILLALLFLGPLIGLNIIDAVIGPAIFALGRFLLGS